MKLSRRELIVGTPLAALAAGRAHEAKARAVDIDGIDEIVGRFMAAFEIPGVAVAIVMPEGAPILRSYGVRKLGSRERVDARTQFAIASNSKAFLSASLAMLVDAGKLAWDDPVTRHLPEFQMYDANVTAMMTIRDLLVHRSGLPLGAGDLMQVPMTDHSSEEMLHALRFFKPAATFRAGYAYDNILYIVAGIVLRRVSGMSWDEFVSSRIFTPLGMVDAVTNTTLATGSNRAARHARLGPPVRGLGKLEVVPPNESSVIGPAGGICVSAAGIVPWLQVQLGRGALPDGRRLWSEEQATQMWKPQTLMSSGPGPGADRPERSVLSAYALGWGVADYRTRRMLSHAGGLSGQVTRSTLLPEQHIGFVVYSNCEDGDAVSGLRYAIMDRLLDAPAYDWLAATRSVRANQESQVAQLLGDGDFKAPPGGPTKPLTYYAGRYRSPWYCVVMIAVREGALTIDFTRTASFKSRLEHFGTDCFRTRFARGAGEDAVVSFSVDADGALHIAMRALSPLADASFDFQDLQLVRVGE